MPGFKSIFPEQFPSRPSRLCIRIRRMWRDICGVLRHVFRHPMDDSLTVIQEALESDIRRREPPQYRSETTTVQVSDRALTPEEMSQAHADGLISTGTYMSALGISTQEAVDALMTMSDTIIGQSDASPDSANERPIVATTSNVPSPSGLNLQQYQTFLREYTTGDDARYFRSNMFGSFSRSCRTCGGEGSVRIRGEVFPCPRCQAYQQRASGEPVPMSPVVRVVTVDDHPLPRYQVIVDGRVVDTVDTYERGCAVGMAYARSNATQAPVRPVVVEGPARASRSINV